MTTGSVTPDTGPTCETCPFRPEKRCRRFPPTAAVGAAAIWPVTQDADWCGEHPGRKPATGRPAARNQLSEDLHLAINPPAIPRKPRAKKR